MINHTPEVFIVRRMDSVLKPIHILASDRVTIIATVHKVAGYEETAARFAASLDLLGALREMLKEYPDCYCTEAQWGDVRGRACGACTARAAIAKAEVA